MLREERLEYIRQKLARQQRVSSQLLSEELQVSDDTIRRDLNELAQAGQLRKVHGGAVPLIPKAPAPHNLNERIAYARSEKEVIATKALQLFENGQTIILDNGSTNMIIAGMLPVDLQATIFTNSLPIAQILCSYHRLEVILVGGVVLKSAQVAIGAGTVEIFRLIQADLCIVGVCSIHSELGVTTPNYEECLVKQTMVGASKRVVATAWKDKFDTAETCRVCDYDELDLLITDSSLDQERLSSYQALGVEIW
ncbi:DeoR/GlpR family DNA-binding transcription regulator [Telluribacter sp. SYSU D00476]|uniref:DeoR/GlpR family DNA-binding transcription regulator n=1 Tax=Telluribacter sp. SYSU D00476 TaxID=2811430 RepID=UPI001FF62FA3|nr:DeoR/GlpR family DNA-binding transcription regulator [Telluribacter sp. SYSU D00476]